MHENNVNPVDPEMNTDPVHPVDPEPHAFRGCPVDPEMNAINHYPEAPAQGAVLSAPALWETDADFAEPVTRPAPRSTRAPGAGATDSGQAAGLEPRRSDKGGSSLMKYRHEWKHEINYLDRLTLLSRLSAVMKRDPHAINGAYQIRSLYFDTPGDTALREKLDGVNMREKYRIRFYNGDTSFLVLEKKSKLSGLCAKQSCRLSAGEAQKIVDGDLGWMVDADRPLCTELYSRMNAQGLRPKTIVDYTRDPFVFGPGNVRVTIDYNIRTGDFRTDFLNPETLTLPAGDSPILLEVKWDDYLPDIIRDAVTLPGRRVSAFSKYAQCRIYG